MAEEKVYGMGWYLVAPGETVFIDGVAHGEGSKVFVGSAQAGQLVGLGRLLEPGEERPAKNPDKENLDKENQEAPEAPAPTTSGRKR